MDRMMPKARTKSALLPISASVGADSRFPEQMGENGFVPWETISGKIVTIMASKDKARIGRAVD
jgi:hypothetical protein